MTQTIIWLIIAILFFIAEAVSYNLITVWFAFGALAAMFVSFITGGNFILEIITFVSVSVVLLILTRPLAKKFVASRTQKTNVDAIIGQKANVIENIDNIEGTGQVKIGGQIWTARSQDGLPIESGQLVDVIEINGVKAIVKK